MVEAPTRYTTENRPRICFIHIPKCGSTSIYNALRKHVPQDRIRHLQVDAVSKAAETVGRGLEYRSDILAYHLFCEDVDIVFGHYQVTATLIDAHPEYEFVTVLREPVSNFLSNFYYSRIAVSRREIVEARRPASASEARNAATASGVAGSAARARSAHQSAKTAR